MKKLSVLLLLPCVVLLSACKDDDNGSKPDTQKPVINLLSPAAGTSQVPNNTTLQISGTVTDNEELGEIHVELLELTTVIPNPYLMHYHIQPGGRSATIDTAYTFSVTGHTDIRLRIQAADARGNTAITERDFHIMP